MRKGRVLNSKTEYSRCKLPRLTVDLEEWRRSQEEEWQAGKERDKLEMARIKDNERALLVYEEQGGEKRKPLGMDNGRMKKRRKLEKLIDWGETPVGVEVEEAR